MKKAKWIYFSVVMLLILVFTVSSFVHVGGAGAKNGVSNAFVDSVAIRTGELAEKRTESGVADTTSEIRNKITTFLGTSGLAITRASTSAKKYYYDEDNNPVGEYYIRYASAANLIKPLYAVQTDKVSFDTLSQMSSTYTDDTLYASVETTVNNIVVYIPGTKTVSGEKGADAILLTAHMDTYKKAPVSEDAADTVMIATMMEQIERIVKGTEVYENDLVFLFTDARYDSSFGIYTFLNQFNGFRTTSTDAESGNDINKRIKFAVNFDSIGTGESSMLIQTSENGSKVVKEYAKAMGGSFSSSFVSDLLKDYQSDFDGMKNVNSLSLVTFGSLQNRGTSADTVNNLGKDYIKTLAAKKGSMLAGVIGHFGNMDLSKLDSDKDSIYFSVMGMFTVSYSNTGSYVMTVVLLLLMAGIIYFNMTKKSFSFKAMARGMACQVVAIAAAMLATFIAFFFMSLILSGFGVFTIQSILSFTYYNAGIIIGYALFMAAMLGLFYNLIKNALGIKATDTVRGGAALFMLVSAVLGFAYPALAYMAVIPAIFVAAVMLINTVLKHMYKQKTGKDIERLILYFIPVMVAIPLMLPVVCVMAWLIPVVFMPIIILPLIMLLALIVPFTAALKPAMNKLFAKLPKHTIRVQRTVTENVEDPAKKGKFTQVTRDAIIKEKVSWKYRHGVLMTFVAVIAVIVIMVSSSVTTPVGASVYGLETDNRSHVIDTMFDDSLILSWSHLGSSGSTQTTALQIHDKALYKELRSVLDGYNWNSDADAYVKNISSWSSGSPRINSPGSATTKRILITPASTVGGDVISEITIKNASGIDSVRVLKSNDDSTQLMEIVNNAKDEIVIRLKDDDDILLEVEYLAGKSQASVSVLYRQFVWISTDLVNVLIGISKDFSLAQGHFGQSAAKNIRFGIYFEYYQTVTYTV